MVASVVSSGQRTATVQQTVFISITQYLLYVNRPGLKDPKPGWRLVRGVINPSEPDFNIKVTKLDDLHKTLLV